MSVNKNYDEMYVRVGLNVSVRLFLLCVPTAVGELDQPSLSAAAAAAKQPTEAPPPSVIY